MKLPTLPPLGTIRKAIINGAGLAAGLVSLGVLHGQVLLYVNAGIALVTAVTHYKVANDPVLTSPTAALAPADCGPAVPPTTPPTVSA